VSDKDVLNAYRAAAAVLINRIDVCFHSSSGLRVNPVGNVQTTEDGAFVEVMLWVPKTALEQDK
jgi:hypothetical protein